jgi:hypothetical protein
MRFNKVFLVSLVLGGIALLAGCGGGGGGGASDVGGFKTGSQAASNTDISINPASGAAVVDAVKGKSFEFTNGISDFGTTASTALALSGSGAAPSFEITSGNQASGAMTFGSCIFTMTTSTFSAPHPLAAGSKAITVTPCTLSVGTAGLPADGSSSPASVTLMLGKAKSKPVSVTVSISPTGVITVNNQAVGTAVLSEIPRATGATGAGS